MVQVWRSPAEVDIRGGLTRSAPVDQLAILDDGVTVTDMVLQEPFLVNVLTVEEFQLPVTAPLQSRLPVEGSLLVAEGAAAVGAAPRVLSVGALTAHPVSATDRLAGVAVTRVTIVLTPRVVLTAHS